MEQATNQFTQGLQMDTHPMVQGNNTLTDCLNGTLVTMNGNEVVLQNDMGNRKIDNAFLPSGYEPVGIKEYGGIIYVAAYNPITNKSQIGSFPSPQTTFSDNNGYKCKVDLNKFKESFLEKNNIEFQKHFSLLFPFQNESGENVILHSGDKFTIYKAERDQNQIEDLIEDLFTNYNNYDDSVKKLKSPKNRKYTLSVGVLNSQNEFVDFTSSLLRWENDGIISFDNNTPDYIKFNRGYFITEEPEQEQSSNESTNDQELDTERNKSTRNTYAYKLTGPLYIKVDFNTIQNLTYNVYGSKYKYKNPQTSLDEDKIKLYIETTYEYNCPDFNHDNSISKPFVENGDDKYKSYEEYNIEKITKEYNIEETIEQYIKSNIYINNSTNTDNKVLTNPVYNPESNTYKVKKLCTIDNISLENNIINLSIIPQTINNLGIKNLSYTDTIEVSKLNSNELDISDFRYYNNLESQMTLIDLGFKSYPEYGSSFQDLKFEIIKIVNSTDKIIKTFDWGDGGYNGVKTFTWNWDDLDEGVNNVSIDDIKSHILKVKVSYKIYKEGNETPKNIEIYRYLMTTKLFNDKYSINSENYERDFSNLNNTKVEISLKQKKNIWEEIQYRTGGDETPFKNSSNEQIETWVDTIKSKLGVITNEFVLDEDLYPEELRTIITVNPDNNIEPIVETTLLYDNDNNNLFLHYNQTNSDSEYDIYDYNRDKATININSNTKILTLSFNEHFRGREKFVASNLTQHYININNLFVSFHDTLYGKNENNYSNLRPYATFNVISKNTYDGTKYGIGFTYQNIDQDIVDFRAISDNAFPYTNNIDRTDNIKFINVSNGTEINSYRLIQFSNYSRDDKISDMVENSGFPTDKFFFVGTNNNFLQLYTYVVGSGFINNLPSDSSEIPTFSIYSGDPNSTNRHYWQTFLRPILFWMKNVNGRWSILPIKQFTKNEDTEYGGYDINNGWLGKYAMTSGSITRSKQTGIVNKSGPVLSKFVDGVYDNNGYIDTNKLKSISDENIADYLTSRFKNFYYIGKYNYQYQVYGISTTSLKEAISKENIFNLKIIIPADNININIPNNYSDLVKEIFGGNISTNCSIDENIIIKKNNIDYIALVDENIEFQKNTEKFEELCDDFLHTFNTIDYALLDNNRDNNNNIISTSIKIYDDDKLKFSPGSLYVKDDETKKITKLSGVDANYENGQFVIPVQTGNCGIYRMYATFAKSATDDSNDELYLRFPAEDNENNNTYAVDIIPSELLKD